MPVPAPNLDPDGYQTVDPDLKPIKWDPQDPQRLAILGGRSPRKLFQYGTTFVGIVTRESGIKASPIIVP